MWSIGNEVPERGEPLGAEEAKMIADYLRGLDRTRPVTSALNFIMGKWSDTDGFYSALDIAGYNYNLNDTRRTTSACRSGSWREPSRIPKPCSTTGPWWTTTRTSSTILSGLRPTTWESRDSDGHYRDPQDTSQEGYGAPYPYHGADCGDIDICGNRRATAHCRNIVWDRGEKLFLGVRQTPPAGKVSRHALGSVARL